MALNFCAGTVKFEGAGRTAGGAWRKAWKLVSFISAASRRRNGRSDRIGNNVKIPLAFIEFPMSLQDTWISSAGRRKSKSQIPNNKSLAQTDLTSEVFIASTARPEKYKGINQASRARAG